MPRLSAGGTGAPSVPNDEQITRVDVAPEDIRTMSDEQLQALLADLRSKRETSPPKAGKVAARRALKTTLPAEPEEIDSLE